MLISDRNSLDRRGKLNLYFLKLIVFYVLFSNYKSFLLRTKEALSLSRYQKLRARALWMVMAVPNHKLVTTDNLNQVKTTEQKYKPIMAMVKEQLDSTFKNSYHSTVDHLHQS